jgi:hypothetical protein
VNFKIDDVTDHTAPAQSPYDLSDWIVIALVVAGFICTWTVIFIIVIRAPEHAVEAFGIGVGATVANGTLYHALDIHDDKKPDAK